MSTNNKLNASFKRSDPCNEILNITEGTMFWLAYVGQLYRL